MLMLLPVRGLTKKEAAVSTGSSWSSLQAVGGLASMTAYSWGTAGRMPAFYFWFLLPQILELLTVISLTLDGMIMIMLFVIDLASFKKDLP